MYLLYYICIAVITLGAGLLARSQYPEGPATGHLDTGFSWFPCVYKRMLRWFPQVTTTSTCLSYSPPDLNFLTWCFPDRALWINYIGILMTNLMHRLLFIYKIFLYRFRAINAHLQEDTLYTCSIWYCHSLRDLVVASQYTAWVRTASCVPTGHHELS